MSASFKNIKTISFDMLDVSKINREKIAKELFLTTFSEKSYGSEELSLHELTKDNILDDFINSLENILSEIEGKEKPHPQDNSFEELFKHLIFKSFLNDDFNLLKTLTINSENTLNLY